MGEPEDADIKAVMVAKLSELQAAHPEGWSKMFDEWVKGLPAHQRAAAESIIARVAAALRRKDT
jgi:hypothetical protein